MKRHLPASASPRICGKASSLSAKFFCLQLQAVHSFVFYLALLSPPTLFSCLFNCLRESFAVPRKRYGMIGSHSATEARKKNILILPTAPSRSNA